MLSYETLFFAFLGGILPAMVWLYFLLKEDRRCPEPRHMIALAVVAVRLWKTVLPVSV